MAKIGGNITAIVQKKTTAKNVIGESEITWEDVGTIKGWLDLQTGDSKHTSFNAKLQESTHVFLADFSEWSSILSYYELKPENSRIYVSGKDYEVMQIDNPMELNQHIEIYLKKVGG